MVLGFDKMGCLGMILKSSKTLVNQLSYVLCNCMIFLDTCNSNVPLF